PPPIVHEPPPPPPPPPPPVALGPYSGRFMSTPAAPYTDDSGDVFDEPLVQNVVGGRIGSDQNQGLTDLTIQNGRLTATLSNGQSLDLPISSGSFFVDSSAKTPLGNVLIGQGYYDPAAPFFYYDIFTSGTNTASPINQMVLVGGTPTPNGGLLAAGA